MYRNASCKNKYSTDPKYSYYNALLTMKQKLSHQSVVYDSVFQKNGKVKSQEAPPSPPPPRKTLMPVYHVEKINKLKFKVYKQGVGVHFVEKLPVTDLSFQIRLKGDEAEPTVKPRLEEILSEYRRMNGSGRKSSRGKVEHRKNSNNSDFNVRMMNHTMSKINRSMSHRR